MVQEPDVQKFLEAYKRGISGPVELKSENERTQDEQRIRRVDLIRDALTTQEDVSRPISPDAFVRFLRDVASGNQAVLPVQRGDAAMKETAADLLDKWQYRDSEIEQRL